MLNKPSIDLTSYIEISSVDTRTMTIEVEGSTTMHALLLNLHAQGYTLPVTPDLSHLTAAGLISGIGGGSASFKNGFYHDICSSMTVASRTGQVVIASSSMHSDLFNAMPGSLGTLGYILKMTLDVVPLTGNYVMTRNLRFRTYRDFETAMRKHWADPSVDFLDGTIFNQTFFVLVAGYIQKQAPAKVDNFVNDRIYWQSLLDADNSTMTYMDYIYRFDTDLYYTTARIPGALGHVLRQQWWRRYFPRAAVPVFKWLGTMLVSDGTVKDIMSDLFVPVARSARFWDSIKDNVPYPVYIVPATAKRDATFWRQGLLVDFGVGYGVDIDHARAQGHRD